MSTAQAAEVDQHTRDVWSQIHDLWSRATHNLPARRILLALAIGGGAGPVFGSTNEAAGPEFGLLIVSFLFL
ncbi:MAG: hypothetical protein V3R27_03180, partial [Pseudomonadales bacterium]